jgi:hypothetical protein
MDQFAHSLNHSKVVLYESTGQPRLMEVSCEPMFSASQKMNCCSMRLDTIEAVTLSEALCTNDCAYVLFSPEWPHSIEMVSQRYSLEIGGSASELVGQPVRQIKPAETSEAAWLHMITTARNGHRAYHREASTTSSRRAVWLDMAMIPVVNSPNSGMEHILLRMGIRDRFASAECVGHAASVIPDCFGHAASVIPTTPAATTAPEFRHEESRQPPRQGRRAVIPLIIDEAYVRRLRRRHQAASRRGRKPEAPALRTQTAVVSAASTYSCSPSAAPAAAAFSPAEDAFRCLTKRNASPVGLGLPSNSDGTSPPVRAAADPSMAPASSRASSANTLFAQPPFVRATGGGGEGEQAAAGPWWDAATEDELLRPAAGGADGGRRGRPALPWAVGLELDGADSDGPPWAEGRWTGGAELGGV